MAVEHDANFRAIHFGITGWPVYASAEWRIRLLGADGRYVRALGASTGIVDPVPVATGSRWTRARRGWRSTS